jgi:hypothetical protein
MSVQKQVDEVIIQTARSVHRYSYENNWVLCPQGRGKRRGKNTVGSSTEDKPPSGCEAFRSSSFSF